MARKSNHQRHVAKLRREKNQLRKGAQEIVNRLRNAETLLSFALAQAGGIITVSKGTGQTVLKNMPRLGYRAQGPAAGREDLDYVVIVQVETFEETVPEQPAEEKPTPSFTMRVVPDDEVEQGQSPDTAVVD